MKELCKEHLLTIGRVVVYAILILSLLVSIQVHLNNKVKSDEKLLNEGWSISVNGKFYEEDDISQFRLSDTHRGDTISLTRTLDKEEGFSHSAVAVLVRYSKLQVYLDGELIYGKNATEYQENKMLGNGYVWIDLPDDYDGQTLKLVFTLGEDNAFNSFESIYMVVSTQGPSILVANNFLNILTLSFFFIVGIMAVVGGIFMKLKDTRFKMLMHLGFFSVSASLWVVCNSRILGVLTDNFTLCGTLEYLALYGAFISMIGFIACLIKSSIFKNICYVMAHAFMIMTFVLFLLNQFTSFHFNRTVHGFQLMGILSIVWICIVLWQTAKEQESKAEKIMLLGVMSFLVLASMELIRYRYNKICIPEYQLKQSFIPFAVGVFIVFMFISFTKVLFDQVAENIEKEKLYDMAYFDTLTGLRNRAWCERIMRSFEKTNRPVTIMNFDLDKFKLVNDTFGHSSGDELLKDFAVCLSHVFRGADCVGRMGGDEFIAILDYIPEDVVRAKIADLSREVAAVNKSKNDGKIFFSVGYADNYCHPELNIWKVYEKSDQAMYQNKNQRKERWSV